MSCLYLKHVLQITLKYISKMFKTTLLHLQDHINNSNIQGEHNTKTHKIYLLCVYYFCINNK